MKKTLLEIVQDVLAAMDSENVNSISETVEASQVADLCGIVFNNVVAERELPEHEELLKLTPASDSDFPTHFSYPDNVTGITDIWYKDDDGRYHEVCWMEPKDFLRRADQRTDDFVEVSDKNGGTNYRVGNNNDPRFYTSFDDHWVVMDSYDNAVDSTLQSSKIRAYGLKYPTFSKTDNYVPDFDEILFPYYVAECMSFCMSVLSGGSDPKVEQTARRQKTMLNANQYKSKRPNKWSNYGR